MKTIEPIYPNLIKEIGLAAKLITPIEYFNKKIIRQDWHDEITVRDENYFAIIIAPAGAFKGLMDNVVEEYKKAGWDCMWGSAYDARGPHECFYVHKKHFEL